MQFNRCTPEEVAAEAEQLARDDIRRHREYGHDLNVFSTPGAREDWRRGFENLGPRSYEGPRDFDTIYQRGRAVARLLEEEKTKGS
jgi:hypothetical protein